MVDMIRVGNTIKAKENGYPYALYRYGVWVLYDHPHNEHNYLAVKEVGSTQEEAETALLEWGWSDTGYEPSEEDLWNDPEGLWR